MEIFKLFGSIFVDNEKANKNINETDKKAQGLGKKFQNVIDTGAKIGAAVVAGTTIAIGAMSKLAGSAAEATDRIDKMSQSIGFTREGFQEWDFILSQSGASIDQLGSGINKLTNSVDDLGAGNKKTAETFKQIGLRYEDLRGLTQQEIFEKTIEGLQGVEDKTKRAALASDLLGKSSQNLAALLNTSAEGVENMKNQAHDMGIVLGDEAIDAGVQYTDALDKFQRVLESIRITLGVKVMPILIELFDKFQENSEQITGVVSVAFETLSEVIGFVIDNLDILIPLIEGLAFVFGALKIIGVITALMDVYKASAFAATVAQEGLNVAMMANPIGLIVLAIGALITILGLLGVDLKELGKAFLTVFEFIGKIVFETVKIIGGGILEILKFIFSIPKSLLELGKKVIKGVVDFGKNLIKKGTDGIKKFLNKIFGFINRLIKGLNELLSFKLPDWMGGFSVEVDIPEIPLLANGGKITKPGMVGMNEFEPEFVNLPSGATVTPLSRMEEIPTGENVTINGGLTVVVEPKTVKEFNDMYEFFKAVPKLGGVF